MFVCAVMCVAAVLLSPMHVGHPSHDKQVVTVASQPLIPAGPHTNCMCRSEPECDQPAEQTAEQTAEQMAEQTAEQTADQTAELASRTRIFTTAKCMDTFFVAMIGTRTGCTKTGM